MITRRDLAAYIGRPLSDTAEYDSHDVEIAAKYAYLEGMREATRTWAYWKDGTQYVGSCGKTLAQALDIIAEEEDYDID